MCSVVHVHRVRAQYANRAICKYEILADFDLAVAKVDHQTVKFNFPPNFLDIQYTCRYGVIANKAL